MSYVSRVRLHAAFAIVNINDAADCSLQKKHVADCEIQCNIVLSQSSQDANPVNVRTDSSLFHREMTMS